MKNDNPFKETITLAITGASGSAYVLRLIECLVAANYQLNVLVSSAARVVLDTEEEVMSYANSTQYGLAATVWTQNITKANRVAANLESGIVWVNCWLVRDLRTPFGGVKNSGVGREGGFNALNFFTEPTNVCIKL